MGSSPQVPNVPDPNVVAANQGTINTKAGQASQAGSNVNQNNAFGSLTYAQTGTSPDGTPLYTANTTLSPEEQQLLTTLQGTQKTAGTAAGNLLTGANYGSVPAAQAIGDATTGLTKDAMDKQVAYLNPYFTTQTSQLDTQLRNQGLAPGQPGYDNAMRALQNNQGNTVTGFLSNIEPQMYQQASQTYQLPASLAGSLAGLGAPTLPNQSFVQTPGLNIQPANLEGDVASANTANMNAYQAQLGQQNAMMSGLFGIPTAVLGGLAKNGSLTGLSGLFGSAGAAGGADAGLAALQALGPAAII